MSSKGVLLINLGSPDEAQPRAVYRYLKEFLNDPRVIDLPGLGRWLLVNLLVAPFRHRKTTKAYQKIWETEGSPLLLNSQNLLHKLRQELGPHFQVELAMRYGQPKLKAALAKLKHCHSLTVIPLYPQYSSSATGSALEEVLKQLSSEWNIPELHLIRDFHDHPGFIAAFAELIQEEGHKQAFDHLIFSYHGLPERQVHKSHCQQSCLSGNDCHLKEDQLSYCYRAQCYRSSKLLAEALQLENKDYSVSFQSRLGRTPWIKPYTDLLLPELRKQGLSKLAIVCPSFVADCLETLEEINMRAREQWLALGGESFSFIPCLNDHPLWVKALAQMVKRD